MSTAQRMAEQGRRLAILQSLSIAHRYKRALPDLRAQLDAVGYAASRDRLAADCAWLEEIGLVETRDDIVTLTQRGLDAAEGYSEIPGVNRPGPEA
jgi:hypothetical protein